jgi:hypothetical protein
MGVADNDRVARAANAGNGGPGGGAQSVMVMAGGNYADMLRYSNCMRSHGVVDFPDPSSNATISFSGAVSQATQYPAADETCHKLLPNGGIPTAAQRAQSLAQLLKVSVCMRAHGIRDFPDRLCGLEPQGHAHKPSSWSPVTHVQDALRLSPRRSPRLTALSPRRA